jgi:hypothetical protein
VACAAAQLPATKRTMQRNRREDMRGVISERMAFAEQCHAGMGVGQFAELVGIHSLTLVATRMSEWMSDRSTWHFQ